MAMAPCYFSSAVVALDQSSHQLSCSWAALCLLARMVRHGPTASARSTPCSRLRCACTATASGLRDSRPSVRPSDVQSLVFTLGWLFYNSMRASVSCLLLSSAQAAWTPGCYGVATSESNLCRITAAQCSVVVCPRASLLTRRCCKLSCARCARTFADFAYRASARSAARARVLAFYGNVGQRRRAFDLLGRSQRGLSLIPNKLLCGGARSRFIVCFGDSYSGRAARQGDVLPPNPIRAIIRATAVWS